jgi:hypothetical protein
LVGSIGKIVLTPELVVGTLEKGYETIMSAANGRTARLAMNLLLTQVGLTRIIIPTVYRDDYISALKAMQVMIA